MKGVLQGVGPRSAAMCAITRLPRCLKEDTVRLKAAAPNAG